MNNASKALTYSDKYMSKYKNDVMQWRKKFEGKYPWPSDFHCLKFAITELGEALDAEMRQHKQYKRNNAKGHGVGEELGDALFMLLSIRDYKPSNILMFPRGNDIIPMIAYASAAALGWNTENKNKKRKDAYDVIDIALSYIFAHEEFDDAYLHETMKKLEGKHIK